MKHSADHQRFFGKLLEHSSQPNVERRKLIEEAIWEEFGVSRAVFVLDMSDFSQMTQRYGIVHYLGMVQRMQVTTRPLIDAHGGSVVKYEADNCFAVFPDVENAIRAGIAMNAAFDGENIVTPDELDVRVACGIDHGDVLLIEEDDFHGGAVNLGSKLGEDLANPGEIIVTRTAFSRVPETAGLAHVPMSFNISGVEIEACSVQYR